MLKVSSTNYTFKCLQGPGADKLSDVGQAGTMVTTECMSKANEAAARQYHQLFLIGELLPRVARLSISFKGSRNFNFYLKSPGS